MKKKTKKKTVFLILLVAAVVFTEIGCFVYAYSVSEEYSFKTPAIQKVFSGELKNKEEKTSVNNVDKIKHKKKDKGTDKLTDSQYLEKSLFIGDSRVVGIQLYSGIKGMDFFCSEGLTIYKLFDEKIPLNGKGKSRLLSSVLKNGNYDRIYLEIGINEMGMGTLDDFMKAYSSAAAKIQNSNPDADVILCSIMNVTKSRSETDKVFNNKRIGNRNRRIQKLCKNQDYCYLDINRYVCGKKGNLISKYSEDSCHLKGKYDYLWKKCILENRISS